MPRHVAPNSFAGKAVDAFENTYQSLFDQSQTEVVRLARINDAMGALEQTLLDPERIRDMEPAQQIALAQMLTQASTATIKNLMQFGTMFMNIRTIVGMLDGIQRPTSLSPDVGAFPSQQGSGEDGRPEHIE